jgi:acetyltransferase-like isoleucine patch superfamily enzyme
MKSLLRKIYYLKSYYKFKKSGKKLLLSPGGKFIRPQEISFGDNVFISNNFHISARNLRFGNNIMIGPNLIIECDDHKYNVVGKRMFELQNERTGNFVTIEDDVWLGAAVTILKNVTIGEGAIVGAGSIVTKSVPPYTIAVGNPCKPIKARFSPSELGSHLLQVKSNKRSEDIIYNWEKHKLI